MKTIISRIAFCPRCESEHRPWKGLMYLSYDTFHGKYVALKANQKGMEGFTPHLFILEQVVGSDCIVSCVCSIHGCGIEYRKSDLTHDMVYGVIPQRWEKLYIPIKEWNALVGMRNDPQYAL